MTETVRRGAPAASQTLTFLFSDLRDYTRFVEQFGDAAATTLIGDYRRIVRAEVGKTAGAEIKTEGDSFYVVFTSAGAAVTCAMAILREAERYSRVRPDRPMKIGIGIHAGEPLPHEGQYVGAAVIVAARLAQTAGPGELLVSEVVRALVPKDLAPMTARPVTLKGIERPPAVFAVEWPRAPEERRAGAGPMEVAVEAAPPVDRRILCPTLVGRDAELAALDALLGTATAGTAKIALIGGDAGLGKTAFLRAFLELARGRGARVLFGECSEIEARRPFGPVVDAFLAAGIPLPDDLRVGGPGAQAVTELERYRAHAALTTTIAEAARTQTVVLAIDDLHWADEATLELVPYLARKLRSARVLVVGAYRTDEMHRTHPLEHVLAELARSRLADEVRLRKLTEDETATVISGALGLGRAPTTAFRRAIHARCEGNPFFVEEVLRALVERGELAYREGAWRRTKEVSDLTIPVSVRDAVQQRLRALTGDALRTIQIAAVIGQRFDFDLLQKVTGQPETEVLGALRAAVDEQLVQEEPGDESEGFRFRHALTRETVLADLLQRERRLLHRRIGETIEGTTADPEDRAEDLAYHFDEARDHARAFRYHEAAARSSTRLLAFARALHHLERAVELAPDDDPQLGPLMIRLADAAFQMNELDRSRRAADEALRIFERAVDVRGQGAALSRASRIAWYFGETDRAMGHARRAVDLLEPLGASRELAEAYAEMARLEMLADHHAAAIEMADRAMSAADALGLPMVSLDASVTRATVVGHDDPAEGARLLAEANRQAREQGFVRVALRSYQNTIACLIRGGASAAEAMSVHEQGLRYMRTHGVEDEAAISRTNFMRFGSGEWDGLGDPAEELERGTIWGKGRAIHGLLAGLAREGPDRYLSQIDGVMRALVAARDAQWVAAGTGVALLARYLVGDVASAARIGAPIRELRTAIPNPHANVTTMVAVRAASLAADAEARDAFLAWLRSTPSFGLFRRARESFLEGMSALDRGDHASALGPFKDLAALDGVMLFSFVSTLVARQWSAEIHAARGDLAAAQAEVDALLPFWRKAKATWYLGRLAEWARGLGLSTGP
jgi:class 3 adenylate cyclase/tetratricopeptide (TPR) repeat protein